MVVVQTVSWASPWAAAGGVRHPLGHRHQDRGLPGWVEDGWVYGKEKVSQSIYKFRCRRNGICIQYESQFGVGVLLTGREGRRRGRESSGPARRRGEPWEPYRTRRPGRGWKGV